MLDERIKEIIDLEEKKDKLLARMRIIEQLQSSRPEVVHLFDGVPPAERVAQVEEPLAVGGAEILVELLFVAIAAVVRARIRGCRIDPLVIVGVR